MLYLKYCIFLFIASMLSVSAQEKIISVPFTQPPQLYIDAGADQVIHEGQPVTLGNDLVVEGGTREFAFTWTRPGNVQDAGQVISADDPGRYTVQVLDSNSCSSIDSLLVTAFTGMDDSSADQVPGLYPNPSDGTVYFRIPEKQVPVTVKIISASGSVLFSTFILPADDETEGCLHLPDLPAGTYVFRVVAGSNQYNEMLIIR